MIIPFILENILFYSFLRKNQILKMSSTLMVFCNQTILFYRTVFNNHLFSRYLDFASFHHMDERIEEKSSFSSDKVEHECVGSLQVSQLTVTVGKHCRLVEIRNHSRYVWLTTNFIWFCIFGCRRPKRAIILDSEQMIFLPSPTTTVTIDGWVLWNWTWRTVMTHLVHPWKKESHMKI